MNAYEMAKVIVDAKVVALLLAIGCLTAAVDKANKVDGYEDYRLPIPLLVKMIDWA